MKHIIEHTLVGVKLEGKESKNHSYCTSSENQSICSLEEVVKNIDVRQG